MFGIDVYTLETLIASLIIIGLTTSTMIWGFLKVRKLMGEK